MSVSIMSINVPNLGAFRPKFTKLLSKVVFLLKYTKIALTHLYICKDVWYHLGVHTCGVIICSRVLWWKVGSETTWVRPLSTMRFVNHLVSINHKIFENPACCFYTCIHRHTNTQCAVQYVALGLHTMLLWRCIQIL